MERRRPSRLDVARGMMLSFVLATTATSLFGPNDIPPALSQEQGALRAPQAGDVFADIWSSPSGPGAIGAARGNDAEQAESISVMPKPDRSPEPVPATDEPPAPDQIVPPSSVLPPLPPLPLPTEAARARRTR